jgi:adenylate cyclase
MTEKRRLAAILAADMVGYSRLMEADENGTIARQKTHRADLIDPKITENNGRIVKTTGDGVLVEFASVVDAVKCAVAIQRGMAEREAEVPKERRIQYRVGVNLGDIVIDDEDILGDGVNVAARLEGIAEPDGICISRKVFHEVRNKLDVGYTYIGEQKFKNIKTPIPVYRILLEPDAAGQVIGERHSNRPRWQLGGIAALAVVLITAGGLAWWQPWVTRVEPASLAKMAFKLPDKPSVAVLPFNNLSGDPKQEFFADGITEDIIAALSRIPNMFVIARNSTYTYKGKPVKVQQVAEDLGIRYVLEGSVQRSEGKVRITAQLIDALSGRHLWADRYDRDFKEIFALQDDVTRHVVTALQVKLTAGEQARVSRRQTDNPEAYEDFLRGNAHFRNLDKANVAAAKEFYEKAVALDSNFASAWLSLAFTHYLDARFRWSSDRIQSLSRSANAVQKTLAIDDTLPGAYLALANLAVVKRQFDPAIGHCEKALTLDPTAFEMAHCARIWTYVGRSEEALELIKEAKRRNPYFQPIYFFILGNAHRLMGNYDDAIAAFRAWEGVDPNFFATLMMLAATYVEAGRMEEARATVKESLNRFPKFSIKMSARAIRYKDPADTALVLDNLRKAGVPE